MVYWLPDLLLSRGPWISIPLCWAASWTTSRGTSAACFPSWSSLLTLSAATLGLPKVSYMFPDIWQVEPLRNFLVILCIPRVPVREMMMVLAWPLFPGNWQASLVESLWFHSICCLGSCLLARMVVWTSMCCLPARLQQPVNFSSCCRFWSSSVAISRGWSGIFWMNFGAAFPFFTDKHVCTFCCWNTLRHQKRLSLYLASPGIVCWI